MGVLGGADGLGLALADAVVLGIVPIGTAVDTGAAPKAADGGGGGARLR